ncbi:MAG: hypothetical protein PVSMB4_14920 [Ktedonobacterales bacterium]
MRALLSRMARHWHEGCLAAVVAFSIAACGTTPVRKPVVLPTGTAGNVILRTDELRYRISQPVGATISNVSKTTYYAMDGQSGCTILHLQELVGTVWRDVMPCATGQPPTVLALAPKSSEPLTFAPGNAPDNANAWQPGVYRLALAIGTTPSGSDATTLVYSPGFEIAGT